MWALRQCSHSMPMTNIKVWQDAANRHMVLFEHPRNMALLFGVGVPCGLLSMRREGDALIIFITQLSYAWWLHLWECSETGSPIPFSRFMAACGNLHSANSSTSHGHVTFFQNEDAQGLGKLHITVEVGNDPGEDITSRFPLVLARNREYKSSLRAQIEFIFSETRPPIALAAHNRRKMEVKISAHFDLPGYCVVEPVSGIPHAPTAIVQPLPTDQPTLESERSLAVGIMHDNLCVHFHCTSNPLGSALIDNEGLNVSAMDLTNKEGKSRQQGWEAGLTLGGSSFGKGEIKHNRGSSSLKETDTLVRTNVIAGTQFQLRNTSHQSRTEQLLSYTAVHSPSLDQITKLEEGGLHLNSHGNVTSDLALPVDLKCRGEFLLIGLGFRHHIFEIGRTLAEFRVKVDKGKAKKLLHRLHPLPPMLHFAQQKMKLEFLVNHEFNIDLYRGGHLYWLLIGVAERAPVPDVLDVPQGVS